MAERWLPVVGYEGWSEASGRGRVRSLDRIVRAGGDGWQQHRDREFGVTEGAIRAAVTGKNWGYLTALGPVGA